jgi:hypothetical protein
MTWNYRVIEDRTSQEPVRSLREVYYTDGVPTYYTGAIPIQWGAGENQRELVEQLLEAFRQPILKEEDFPDDSTPF